MSVNASSIKEHAKVVGTDGQHMGLVDHVQGDKIKLTKDSKASQDKGGGSSTDQHAYLPLSMVGSVDADGTVRLNVGAEQAKMAIKAGQK